MAPSATPSPSSAPIDEFLRLIQDPFKSQFQVRAVWVSVATYLGSTVALTLAFSLLRPHNSVVYAARARHADRRHAPPPIGRGLFAWVSPVLRTHEPQCVATIGVDAAVFLRFTRMCRDMLIVLTVLGCAIMIPVNMTMTTSTAPSTSGMSKFLVMTPINIRPGALWSHVVCAWVFDAVIVGFLWWHYRAVLRLRRAYFASDEYLHALHARTILVRHIPPRLRSNEGLLRLTDKINPSAAIPVAAIGRSVKELPRMVREHEECVRTLERVIADYFKDPDNLPPKRPTCRAPKRYRGDGGGKRVDAIEYLTDRIRDLEFDIRALRAQVDERAPMPYGFVSWDAIENAHRAAYVGHRSHPDGTAVTLAPRPNDILWENLARTRGRLRWNRFVHWIWAAVLTVLWIVPNGLIAIFLTNLSNLGLVWPGFNHQLQAHKNVWSAIQGIASPAVTSFVYLVLPIIFRRLAQRSGDMSKTSRECHVIHSLYAFFVFNNLIVFSIFSVAFTFISTVISTAQHASKKNSIWKAIHADDFFGQLVSSLCVTSPFWITYALQRNLSASLDLSQLINMALSWIARAIHRETPRDAIERTAPQPFLYASYYNYLLFYTTVALCFATVQPIILPATMLYFGLDYWMKKYLLLYVFATKTESGGSFWRVVCNRIIFAAILANFVIALVIKSRDQWVMIYCLCPLPFFMLGFKWYCNRFFDRDFAYYAWRSDTGVHPGAVDALAAPDADTPTPKPRPLKGKKHKLGAMRATERTVDRLATRFGNPVFYKPLMTPMVHASAADALEKIISMRQGAPVHIHGEYSDVALHRRSETAPAAKRASASAAEANGFEIVADNQLDIGYWLERPEFHEELGSNTLGHPDDYISRSGTPASFSASSTTLVSGGSSSRVASPAPPMPRMPVLPPTRNFEYRGVSPSPSLSRSATPIMGAMGMGMGAAARGMYTHHSNTSDTDMLLRPETPSGSVRGGFGSGSGGGFGYRNDHDQHDMDHEHGEDEFEMVDVEPPVEAAEEEGTYVPGGRRASALGYEAYQPSSPYF